jgi:hypothetical protein
MHHAVVLKERERRDERRKRELCVLGQGFVGIGKHLGRKVKVAYKLHHTRTVLFSSTLSQADLMISVEVCSSVLTARVGEK